MAGEGFEGGGRVAADVPPVFLGRNAGFLPVIDVEGSAIGALEGPLDIDFAVNVVGVGQAEGGNEEVVGGFAVAGQGSRGVLFWADDCEGVEISGDHGLGVGSGGVGSGRFADVDEMAELLIGEAIELGAQCQDFAAG